MNREKGPPVSDHFELVQVAEGVHVALASPGGAAISNAGIVDLGDQTLVFDTFEAPQAARDLEAAAVRLTGRPPSLVINSHAHFDHWGGNQVFVGRASILSSHATRSDMPASSASMRQLAGDPAQLVQVMAEESAALPLEPDPRRRASLEISIARMAGWLDMLPTLDFFLPDQTFEGRLILHGSRRRAELVEVAPAHTASDVYLLLPEEGIMLMGDLGFFQSQPYMASCHRQAWAAFLEAMQQTDIETFLPGHGPLGSREDLALQRRYMAVIDELVARVIQEGGTVADALAQPLPPPFAAWLHGGMARWDANIQSIYQRRAACAAGS